MDEISDNYYNNPNKSFIVLGLFGWFIIIVFSVSYFIFTERTMVVALGIILGSLLPLLVCYREFVLRPIVVIIRDDDIIMRWRRNKEVPVLINQVVMIYYHIGNPDSFFGRFATDGGVFVKQNARTTSFLVSAEIAKYVQERYFKKMGHYPERHPGSDG